MILEKAGRQIKNNEFPHLELLGFTYCHGRIIFSRHSFFSSAGQLTTTAMGKGCILRENITVLGLLNWHVSSLQSN